MDIDDLVGTVTFGNVWALLVDGRFGPDLPPALAELRERRPDRSIETNVEFWAAVLLEFAEVPTHMMPAMFTGARTAGWCAHVLEQQRTGRLVRPSARYVGPAPRAPQEVAGGSEI